MATRDTVDLTWVERMSWRNGILVANVWVLRDSVMLCVMKQERFVTSGRETSTLIGKSGAG